MFNLKMSKKMKKFFSLMLVALVMLGVTACEQDVTIDTPKSEGLSFYAEIAMTRADLEQGTDGKWATVWEGNETLYVNEFAFTNTESEPSKFTCTTEGVADLVGEDVTIKMENNSVPESGKGIMIEQSITAFDPTSTINLTAKNAFFRFTYTGDVTFTLSQPLFVVDGEEVDTITVTADGDTWVSVLPGTADLSFEGSANGETKTKENFNIVAGKIYNLGTLTDNTAYVYKPITSLVDLTDGEYIIVATVDDKSYAMSDTLSSGKINGSEIQLTDGVVSLENAEGFVWNIAKITDGNFSISNGTKYLSWSSSTSFALVDDVYSWIPSFENEGWKFVAGTTANQSTVRCILFQTQNGNNRFAPYAVSNFTSTDYKPIKLYKKMAENEEPYKTPIITADITSKSVGVEGEMFEISVTATNFDVKDIVVEKDVEWFTATHNGEGKIAVSVAENATTSVREGYITISYPGATSVVVTLSQAANAVKVTIAEFLAAAEDDTLYELSGTITNVVNTTFGNFYLTDDTGSVYIYGLYNEEGASAWDESGAKLGDDITIKTVRSSYNGTAQGENAIFVELVSPGTRAFWTFDKTNVDFASDGGSVDVNVEIYNLDEEVKVASDNAQFTASYTDGVLTITATENTVSEVIEGKITVICGTLSQIIAVTQKAPAAAGENTVKYTFSGYTAGTQYAEGEVHKLDEVLTITTTQCHFTTQLRIYSSDAHNGYAIGKLADGNVIKSLGFNAGNKVDTLNVYGSTDGTNWTLVSGVSITSTSYNDYTVDFVDNNYTYFKLDVEGANQIRIASLTLTYIPSAE